MAPVHNYTCSFINHTVSRALLLLNGLELPHLLRGAEGLGAAALQSRGHLLEVLSATGRRPPLQLSLLQVPARTEVEIAVRDHPVNEGQQLRGDLCKRTLPQHRTLALSQKNPYYYYSNEKVANYVEGKTSLHCSKCGQVFKEINQVRRHMDKEHHLQFWYWFKHSVMCVSTTANAY